MMEDIVKMEEVIKEEPIEEYENIYDEFQDSVNNELPTCHPPLLVLVPQFVEDCEEGPVGGAALLAEEEVSDASSEEQADPLRVKRETADVAQNQDVAENVCQTSSNAPEDEQGTNELRNVHRLLEPSELPTGASAAGFHCACGKVYVHKTSLYGHVRTCTNKASHTGTSGGTALRSPARAPVEQRAWREHRARGKRGRRDALGVLHMALRNSDPNAPKNAFCACGKVYSSRKSLGRHVREQLKRISRYTNRAEGRAVQEVIRSSETAVGNGTKNKERNKTTNQSILETILRGDVDEECSGIEQNVHTGVAPRNKHPQVNNKAQANRVPVGKESTQGKTNLRDVRRSLGTDGASTRIRSPSMTAVAQVPGISSFRCFCGESFHVLGNLLTHVLAHEERQALDTGAGSARKELPLQENTSKSEDETYYQCDMCDQSFPKLSLLVLHRRSHEMKGPLKQQEKRKTGRDEDIGGDAVPVDLMNVLPSESVEPVVNVEDKNHQCGSCGTSFRKISRLSSHTCRGRNIVSAKQKIANLKNKNGICDAGDSVNREKKVHECDTCGRSFKELSHLKTHKRWHGKFSGEQKTGSDESQNKTCDTGDVVERKKNDGEHKCDICGRSFKAMSHLMSHLRYHAKIRAKQRRLMNLNKGTLRANGERVRTSRRIDSCKPVKKIPESFSQCDSSHCSQVDSDGVKNVTSAQSDLTSTSICNEQLKKPSPPAIPVSLDKKLMEDRAERYCNDEAREMTDLEVEGKDTNIIATKASRTLSERSLTAAHGKERHFSCECGAELRSSVALANHSSIHLRKREYICNICGKLLKQKFALIWHLRFHNYQKEYKCIKCNTSFARHSEFVFHKRLHRFRVPCCVCRKIIVRSTCGSQQTRSHSRHDKYFCTGCDKSRRAGTTTSRGATHSRQTSVVLRSTSSVSSPTLDDVKTCGLCSKVCTDTKSYQEHMALHLGECAVLVECISTVPKVKNDDGEKRPETSTLDNSSHCKNVSDALDTPRSVGKSKQLPKKKKEYSCPCGRVFNFLSSLRGHLCKYKGYECDVCNKVFWRKESLHEHTRIHTGKKKYQCRVCLQQFRRFRELERHKRIHTKETTADRDCQNMRQLASTGTAAESSQEETPSNEGPKTSKSVESHGNSYIDETISDHVSEHHTKEEQCLLMEVNENAESNLESADNQMTLKSDMKSPMLVKEAIQNSSDKQSSEMLHLFSKVMPEDVFETERNSSKSLKYTACAEKPTTDHNGEQSEERQPLRLDMNSEDKPVAEEEEEKGKEENSDNDNHNAVRCDVELGDEHHNSKTVVGEQPTKISSALDEVSQSDMEDNPYASTVSKPLNHQSIKRASSDQINIHQNTTAPLRTYLKVNSEDDDDNYSNWRTMSSDFKMGRKRSSRETSVELVSEPSRKFRKLCSTLGEKGDILNVVDISKSFNHSFVKDAVFDAISEHMNTIELELSTLGVNSEENPMVGSDADSDDDDNDDDDEDDDGHKDMSCDPNLGKNKNIIETTVEVISEHTSKKLALCLELDEDSQSDIKREEQNTIRHSAPHGHSFMDKTSIDQIDMHQNAIKLLPLRPNSEETKGAEKKREFERTTHKIHHADKATVDLAGEQPEKKCHLSLELDEIFNSDVEARDRRHTIESVFKPEKQNQANNKSEVPSKKCHSALQVSRVVKTGGSCDPAESTFVCDVCSRPFADSDALQVHKHVWGNVPCNINRWQNTIQSRPATVTDTVDSGWSNSAGPCVVDVEKGSNVVGECSTSESAEKEKYQCCCGKKYCCRDDLARHASRKQQQRRHEPSRLERKTFKCKYCSALFKLSSELLLHKLDCDRRKFRFNPAHTRTGHVPPPPKSFATEEPSGVPVLLSVPVLVNGAFAWGSVVAMR